MHLFLYKFHFFVHLGLMYKINTVYCTKVNSTKVWSKAWPTQQREFAQAFTNALTAREWLRSAISNTLEGG